MAKVSAKAVGSLAIDTVPLPERKVRITIPAKVAFDLGSFRVVIGNLAERLGCRACLSGVDCTFQLERGLLVNANTLKIESVKGGVIIDG